MRVDLGVLKPFARPLSKWFAVAYHHNLMEYSTNKKLQIFSAYKEMK